jgi:hypothetical protein
MKAQRLKETMVQSHNGATGKLNSLPASEIPEVLKEYLRILFSSILAICDLSELIPMSFGKLVPVDDKLSVTNKCCLIRA